MGLLKVEDLHVAVDGRLVLRGVSLEVPKGETHVVFGPNGSGKTSLAMSIIGYPGYKVVSGRILFKGVDITGKPVDERVRMGMGVVFQNPPKVLGVRLKDLIFRIAGDGARREEVLRLMDELNMNSALLNRYVNVGFSGGEVKRSEVAQVLAMKPDLLILDEPDSGVDVENLELIGVKLAEALEGRSGLVITHHGYILRYLNPVKAHVMVDGVIVCSGEPERILSLIMREGYRWCERCALMGKD